jgi:prevent-host-death family protein
MIMVNIAKLKARISYYLRTVRAGGELVVTDRSTPIARIIPFEEKEPSRLQIRKAKRSPSELANLVYAPVENQRINSLDFLIEERGLDR